MSITVDLEPLLEAALKQRAGAVGLTVEDYVRRLAERDVFRDSLDPRVEESVRISEPLRGKIGVLPEGALALEALYGDR